MLPIAVFSILYSQDLVSLIYFRGAFTKDSAEIVGKAFQAYAPQVLISPFYLLLFKTMHSLGDTRSPFKISLLSFIMNAVLSAILVYPFGVFGIALATTLSQFAGCMLLSRKLKLQIGFSEVFFCLGNIVKFLLCGFALLFPRMLLPRSSCLLWNLLYSGGVTIFWYLFLTFFLFHKELIMCLNIIKNR